jgi:hypothetical protein
MEEVKVVDLGKSPQMLKGCSFLVAAPFLFLGTPFFLYGCFQIWSGTETRNWPETTGVITDSKIETAEESRLLKTKSSSREGTKRYTYRVQVRYTYTVGNKELEGTRIKFGYEPHESLTKARSEQTQLSPGKEVRVFYKPENPTSSVLIKGAGHSAVFLIIGTVLIVIGLLPILNLLFQSVRESRAKM